MHDKNLSLLKTHLVFTLIFISFTFLGYNHWPKRRNRVKSFSVDT